MHVHGIGVAGTLQSNDCLVRVEPFSKIEVTLESSVKNEFGDHIEHLIRENLSRNDITHCKVTIEDKGALDCTIIARLQTAIERSQG
ncbi:MAG: citrate lyase acyl carrier protein [Spirochaetaceae bacterium]|nr:citrate lyase acyl carrier protein [Spirochaetaceae bacterium]